MERQTFLVATHLFLIKNDMILLYLRKGGKQEKMYNVIAGHLDGGESPLKAIIREAEEEAGIKIKKDNLEFSHVSYSITGKGKEIIQFYFSCQYWEGEIKNLELDRCYEMDFFSIKKLPRNTTPYIKEAIRDYLSHKTYNEYK